MACEETKVVYHVDEEKTPYLIKLPLPPEKVTLAELKNALNKPNFKYFFKSVDDDFGVVKEEVTDENTQLPYFNGRVVCWLVSAEGSVISDSHLPVSSQHRGSDAGSQLSTSVGGSSQPPHPSEPRPGGIGDSRPPSFHGCGSSTASGGSISINHKPHLQLTSGNPTSATPTNTVGDSDTLCDTGTETEDSVYGIGVVPRPQKDRVPPLRSFQRDAPVGGRHRGPAYGRFDTTNSSMMSSDLDSTSFFDSEDESSRFSTATGTTFSSHRYGRHRQQRRRRRLPPISRASSFSSVTESSMSLNIVTVTLNMASVSFLGISIVGQSNRGSGDGGIYVGSIMKGGAVAQDGRIQPGDMILEVNGISFESMSNDEAVRTLREQVQRPGPITLTVAKCWDNGGGTLLGGTLQRRHGSPPPVPPMRGMSSGMNEGASTTAGTEAVRPIDPRAWLLHTNASMEQAAMNAAASGMPGYPGGVQVVNAGAPSVITSSSLPESERYLMQQQHAHGASGVGMGDPYPLSIHSDIHTVVRAMSAPDSGLEVRDRLWLKIVLPRAFIGSDLVDWLYRNLQGFQERREARKYATQLLKFGYIRHTVNKASFSEQCYYVLGDVAHTMSRLSLEEEVDSVSQIGAQPPVMPTAGSLMPNFQSNPQGGGGPFVTPLPPPTWQHTASTALTAGAGGGVGGPGSGLPSSAGGTSGLLLNPGSVTVSCATTGGNSSQYSSVASPPLYNSPGVSSAGGMMEYMNQTPLLSTNNQHNSYNQPPLPSKGNTSANNNNINNNGMMSSSGLMFMHHGHNMNAPRRGGPLMGGDEDSSSGGEDDLLLEGGGDAVASSDSSCSLASCGGGPAAGPGGPTKDRVLA